MLIADHPGLRFRTLNSIKARYVSLSTYSSGYVAGQTLWYDDIVIAKSYIGPMQPGSPAEPASKREHFRKGEKVTVVFHDIQGRVRCSEEMVWNEAASLPVKNRNLPNGLYLVRITGVNHLPITVKRMVLE